MSRRGVRFGVFLAWLLSCTVSIASPGASAVSSDRCEEYLDWVGEKLRARLERRADAASRGERMLCEWAGIGSTRRSFRSGERIQGFDRQEHFGTPVPGHGIKPPWAGIPLVASIDDDYGPILGTLAREWHVETALGGKLRIDTGSTRTIAPAAMAPRILEYGFADVVGTFEVTGIVGTEAIAGGAGQLTGVVKTPDVDSGLLGRDVLLSRGRFCLDLERALLRTACADRGAPAASVPIHTTPSGHLLMEIAIEAVTERGLALLDSGTSITTVAWRECPADGIHTVISDPLGVHDGHSPMLVSTLLQQALYLTDAAEATLDLDPVLCHRTHRARPLLILGMSFLNRFAAIEVNGREGRVRLYH